MTPKRESRAADRLSASSEFAEWVDAFDGEFDNVYRSLRRHGVAVDDAEDLAQDVFVVMWRRREDYDPERPLRAWLSGIAYRVAYDYRRRRGREVPSGFIDAQDEAARPDDRIASAAARRLVRASLERLPAKYSAIIVMHDLDGVSMHQIAADLQVPLQTAYSRLRAARNAFAKMVRRLHALATFEKTSAVADELLTAERTAPPPPLEARRRVIKRVRAGIPAPLPPAAATGLALGKTLALGAGALALVGGALLLIRATTSGPRALARPARPPGLSGLWRFDEAPGSLVARDQVGDAHCELRRNSDPDEDWIPGHRGGAIRFRARGWLECPGSAFQRRISQEMTVAAWVWKNPSQAGLRAIVSRQVAATDRDYFFLGFTDDRLLVNSHVRGATLEWPLPPQPRGWLHVAATLDRDGVVRLLVDGQEVGRAQGNPVSLGGGDNPIVIGAGRNGPASRDANQRFQGAVDELHLYDRALSDAEIRALAGRS